MFFVGSLCSESCARCQGQHELAGLDKPRGGWPLRADGGSVLHMSRSICDLVTSEGQPSLSVPAAAVCCAPVDPAGPVLASSYVLSPSCHSSVAE